MDGGPETPEVNGEGPTAQTAGQGNDAGHASMQATVGGTRGRQPPRSEASKRPKDVGAGQFPDVDADVGAQVLSFGYLSDETGSPGGLDAMIDLPVRAQDGERTEAMGASASICDPDSADNESPSEGEERLEEPTPVAAALPMNPPTGGSSSHQPQPNTAVTATTVDATVDEVLPGGSMGVPLNSPKVQGTREDAIENRATEGPSPILGLRRLDSDTTTSLEFLLTLNGSSTASGEEEGGMERGQEEANGMAGMMDSDAPGDLCLLLMGGGGASEIEEMLQGEEQQDGEDYQDRNRDREELILLVAQLRQQVKKLEAERDALEDMLVEEQLRNHSHQASEVASSLFSEGPPGLVPLYQPPLYLQAGELHPQAQGGAARGAPSLDLHDSLEALMSWSEVHDTMLSDDSAEAARERVGEGQQPAAASEDMQLLLAEVASSEGKEPLEEMLVHEQMTSAALGLELDKASSRVVDLEEEGAILRDSLVRAEVFRFYLFQKLWQQQRQIEHLRSAHRGDASGQSTQLRAPGNQEPVRVQPERQQKDRGAKKKRKFQQADEAGVEPGPAAVGALKAQGESSTDTLLFEGDYVEGQLSARSNAARLSFEQPRALSPELRADSYPAIHATVSDPAREAAVTSGLSDFQWLSTVLGEVQEGPWFDKRDDAFLTARHLAYVLEDSDADSESTNSLSCLLELGAAELAAPLLLGAEAGGAFEFNEHEFGSESSFVRELLFEAVQQEDVLSVSSSSGCGEVDVEEHALRERMALLQLVADVLPCSPRGEGEHEERERVLTPQHHLRESGDLLMRPPRAHGGSAGRQQALHGVFRMERRDKSISISGSPALRDDQPEPLARETQSLAAQESTDSVVASRTRSEACSVEAARQQLLLRSEDNVPAKAQESSAVVRSNSKEPTSAPEETEGQVFLKRLRKLVHALPTSPRGEEDRDHTQGQDSPLAHLAKSQSHGVEALSGRTEDLMETRSQTRHIKLSHSEGLPSARVAGIQRDSVLVGPLRHQGKLDQPTSRPVPSEGLFPSTRDAVHHEQAMENRDSTDCAAVENLATGASAQGDVLTQVIPSEELQPDFVPTKRPRVEEHCVPGDAMQELHSCAPGKPQPEMTIEAAPPLPQTGSEVELLPLVQDSEGLIDEHSEAREQPSRADRTEADGVRDECKYLSEALEAGASDVFREPPDQALSGSASAPESGPQEPHVPVERTELGLLEEAEASDLGSVAENEEAQDPELCIESVAVTPGASSPGALTAGSPKLPEDVASFLNSLATEGVPECPRVEPELAEHVECKALEVRPEASSISVPQRLQRHPWHPQDSDLQHLLHKTQARHCVSSVVLGMILPRTPVSRSSDSLGSISGPKERNGVGLTGTLFKALPSPESSGQKPSVYKHLRGCFGAGHQ